MSAAAVGVLPVATRVLPKRSVLITLLDASPSKSFEFGAIASSAKRPVVIALAAIFAVVTASFWIFGPVTFPFWIFCAVTALVPRAFASTAPIANAPGRMDAGAIACAVTDLRPSLRCVTAPFAIFALVTAFGAMFRDFTAFLPRAAQAVPPRARKSARVAITFE